MMNNIKLKYYYVMLVSLMKGELMITSQQDATQLGATQIDVFR